MGKPDTREENETTSNNTMGCYHVIIRSVNHSWTTPTSHNKFTYSTPTTSEINVKGHETVYQT